MIIREHYLKQIRPFYESDLIKIITGIRRCGKSVILKQVLNELEAAGKKCLFLDFDQRPVRANIPDAEAKEYADQLGRRFELIDYLVWGGFPAALELQDEESMRRYLNDLNNTIIYNDLENRYNIRKKDVFERIADYTLVYNARIFSAKSISDYMKGQNISISVPTVIKYLGYLKEAYVIEGIPLYSPKAKAKLNYYYKLYDEDVSLNSIRISGSRYDLTHNLENIVLNELLYLGYEVSVYSNKVREIDFRAVRDGKQYLVQVAYSVAEDKAYDREFSAFAGIDNTVKKIIITNDDIDYSTSTVYHYKLRDFLLMNEL